MSEVQEKMKYISANILEKGYNPEDLSNFVVKKVGKPIESIKLEQLKKLIEQFKDQSLQETYKNIDTSNQEEVKENKPEEVENPLYSPATYTIKTTPQQENLLLKLENEKKPISIIISEPKKEVSKGLFSKKVYFTYKVECPEIKTSVRRTYADFEWLKNQLGLYYSLRVLPPIMKESSYFQNEIVNKKDSEDVIEQAKIKYLNFFFFVLIKKKIFRTSAILYEFLELNDVDFKKYKELLRKYKYDLNVNLDNLKAVKNEVKFELKPIEVKSSVSIGKRCNQITTVFSSLERTILNLSNDFKNLEIHMKEIGAQFENLQKLVKINENTKKLENIYEKLSKIFNGWSSSCGKQNIFFKDNFRTFFNFLNLEFQEMNFINQQFTISKKEYEDFSAKLLKRKEELFAQKDQSKWGVEPGTEDQIPKYVNNKNLAFEKMLFKDTNQQQQEKKFISCIIHFMRKEFNKLLKMQGDNLHNYFAKMKQDNQMIVGDAFNLIKLFSTEKEEE